MAIMLCLCSKVLGGLQTPNPSLDGFDAGCNEAARPCWQGIVPGVTTISAAREIVEALGYEPDNTSIELSDRVFVYRSAALSPGCVDLYYVSGMGLLESVVLRCMSLRVGDIVQHFGMPAQRWGILDGLEALHYPHRFEVSFNYARSRLNAYRQVDSLYVRASQNNLFNPPLAVKWHGFVPVWRYCQLEADCVGADR